MNRINYLTMRLQVTLNDLLSRDRGATAVEYGIMVAAISAVIITTVFAIGLKVNDTLFNPVDQLLGANQGG